MTRHIYLVEDHPLMRQVVGQLVAGTPGLDVVGTADSGEAALDALADAAADLVLVDVSLPNMNGVELVAEIQARWPGLRCLMLSGHLEPVYAQRALAAGARGYVLKGNPAELTDAIHRVLGGEVYLSEPVRDVG